MEQQQFQAVFDARGDLYVFDGFLIDKATGGHFMIGQGTAVGANMLTGQIANTGGELAAFPNAQAATFLGGSGRNLILAGLPAADSSPDGLYRAGKVGVWGMKIFTVEVTGPSAATLHDGTAVVAELTTGGTAPVGGFASTTHGADTYNASTPFTLTAVGETGWPGAAFDIDVGVGAGSVQGGRYEPTTDAGHYASVIDPDWTFTVNTDGSVDWKYDGTTIATRDAGPADDPCGLYLSTAGGEFLNPDFAEEDDGEPAGTNPFGVLELIFSWPATPDLDIGVRFLGLTAGYGYFDPSTGGPVGDYMVWSGDDTGPAGSETVTINLGAAWDDGLISTFAEVLALVDWFPDAGGSGPASLQVTYTPPGGSPAVTNYDLHPGRTTPATTPTIGLRIGEDESVTVVGSAWRATVKAYRRAPAEGVAYVMVTEISGEVDSVAGPFFAAVIPTPSGDDKFFPLAVSDGAGGLKQIHSGPLVWGRGQKVVLTSLEDYLDLDPDLQMNGTIYVVPVT